MAHVGMALPSGGHPEVVSMARAIDDAGLDGVWCGDHLAWPGSWLDAGRPADPSPDGSLPELTLPGRPPPRVAAGVLAAPGADAGAVVERLRVVHGLDTETAAPTAVGGSPDQLAEGLARYRDAGADTLVVVPFGSDPLTAAGLLGQARALL